MTPARDIPGVAELKRLFAESGVRPNRRLGQNFLVDPEAMRFVAGAAELTPDDVVLEPGPGTGALTALLAERAGAVVAVELDARLFELVRRRLAERTNVSVLHADILGPGDDIADEARRAVAAAMKNGPAARFKVVSNLPYGPSTAFIAAALSGRPTPAEMIVMVQREVAARLCAGPGSPDYGYLSVLVQLTACPQMLRRLSPKAFWPQPEIDSAIVRLIPRPERPSPPEMARLLRVAGGVFRHRRKQLLSALVTSGLTPARPEAQAALERAGIAPAARAETLTPQEFILLARALS